MNPPINPFLLILKEACQQSGYSFRIIDEYSNNLAEVSDGKRHFFAGNGQVGMYPTNPQFASRIAKDKAWCYKILEQKGYKTPRGDYFFLSPEYRDQRGDGKEKVDAFRFAQELGYAIFVKPNRSSQGVLAEVIHHADELEEHLDHIAQISYMALIQEVIDQPEYRIFAVDGKVEFAYRRSHGKIKGDGKKTLRELLSEINQRMKSQRNLLTENSLFIQKQLKENNLAMESVLEEGRELKIAAKSNLASGGEIEDYTETVSPATQAWVKELLSDIPLFVCGIDIFAKGSIHEPEGFTVIELNHNPHLTGIHDLGKKEKAVEIFTKVMKRYFEER